MTSRSDKEIEYRYMVKVIGILAVLLATLWNADTGVLSSLLL